MKWEYLSSHIEVDPREDHTVQLNDLGKEGWELVAVAPIPSVAHHYRCFFKRPAQ